MVKSDMTLFEAGVTSGASDGWAERHDAAGIVGVESLGGVFREFLDGWGGSGHRSSEQAAKGRRLVGRVVGRRGKDVHRGAHMQLHDRNRQDRFYGQGRSRATGVSGMQSE